MRQGTSFNCIYYCLARSCTLTRISGERRAAASLLAVVQSIEDDRQQRRKHMNRKRYHLALIVLAI